MEEQEKLIRLINALFPSARIYLYGSRARGTHKPESDFDIALDIGYQINVLDLTQARNVLDQLYIPQRIDLIDLHSVPELMKQKILNEGIEWKS